VSGFANNRQLQASAVLSINGKDSGVSGIKMAMNGVQKVDFGEGL
jgi:hypothetical protein